MDLVVLIGAIVVVILVFRSLKSLVYFIVFIDILLRILSFIKENITSQKIYIFLNENIPLSIVNIIDKYSSDIVNEIIIWIYVGIFIIFEYYIIEAFFKKKL